MTFYAIGLPGHMPRLWVECAHEATARAQCHPGEVISPNITLGEDGRPVAVPLPAA